MRSIRRTVQHSFAATEFVGIQIKLPLLNTTHKLNEFECGSREPEKAFGESTDDAMTTKAFHENFKNSLKALLIGKATERPE